MGGMFKGIFKKLKHRGSSPQPASSESAEGVENASDRNISTSSHSGNEEELTGLLNLGVPVRGDHDLEDNYQVDVVVIHGLNGHPKKTWTHKNGTNWPQSLLPQVIPGARIFSYGYSSRIIGSRSVAGVRDFAKDLLSRLSLARAEDKHFRPIIYVCHSLGGIVFKQAMVFARNDTNFRSVWQGSKAVIFMGTPHRGSDPAKFGEMIGDITNIALLISGSDYLYGSVNTSLFKVLRKDSEELSNINEDFIPLTKFLNITSFYETKTHPSNRLIVERSSAILGLLEEKRLPLNANHQDLCRFSGPKDQNYIQVSETIRTVVKTVLQKNKTIASSLNTDRSFSETEKICTSMLNTVDVASFESKLDVMVEGTLKWVLSNTQYINWISDATSNILWVTGFAGCGKTILASYIMRYLTGHLPPGAIVCRFFCDNKVEELRNASDLIRSLIVQIANQRRRLWGVVAKALEKGGPNMFRQFDTLWSLFVHIIRAANHSQIIVILDAIDECDKKTQILIIHRISELLDTQDSPFIKFFLTSRPNADAAFEVQEVSPSRLIWLPLQEKQDQINGDITLVIQHRLERIIRRGTCTPTVRKLLEQLLVAKADRTFLWITLILPQLEERRFLLPPDVESFATQLPSDLSSLYKHLLSSIPEDDRAVAAKMLRLLVASDRPLTSDELGIMMTIDATHTSTSSFTKEQLQYNEKSAQAALGPLVRVYGSKLELVHQSLKDYLIDLRDYFQDPFAAIFGVDIVQDKMAIFFACSSYLVLDEFRWNVLAEYSPTDSSSGDSPMGDAILSNKDESSDSYEVNLRQDYIFKEDLFSDEETWARITDEYKLFDYAALHWALDSSKCSSLMSDKDHTAALALCSAGTAQLTNWFRYYWFKHNHPENYPTIVDAVMITSYFGQVETLRHLLLNPEPPDQNALMRALYWAAREGQAECVKLLLNYHNIDIQRIRVNGQAPLSAVAQFGRLDCASILLNDVRIDVNAKDDHGCTPLSLAASNNHAEITALLLGHQEVSVDVPDNRLNTPLHMAVAAKSYKIVSQLLSNTDVNANCLDKAGRSALSWAAEYGSADIVQLLIRYEHVEVMQKDLHDRTPVSYAAQYGHLEVLKLLIKSKRVDLLDVDKNGRNAHSWAAEQRNSNVLRYLIKQCQDGADVEDVDGWSPMAWTFEKPGYPENARALLQTGRVDVNRQDRVNGRTFLSLAASYDYPQMVSMLSSIDGIQLECRDFSGRTPLSDAAGRGSIEIIRLLLETGVVDVNSRDNNGCTPLSWACREGHGEAVEELLLVSNVDAASKDDSGRTALNIAQAFGHDDLVSVFQRKGIFS